MERLQGPKPNIVLNVSEIGTTQSQRRCVKGYPYQNPDTKREKELELFRQAASRQYLHQEVVRTYGDTNENTFSCIEHLECREAACHVMYARKFSKKVEIQLSSFGPNRLILCHCLL